MKKLLAFIFILTISTQLFGSIKEKHLIGKWKYTVETPEGNMTGVFKFVKTDGKLSGDVITDDGYTIPFTRIEIQEKDTLYLELQTDSDTIKVTVVVDGDKFKGTGTSYNGDAPITGEKVE